MGTLIMYALIAAVVIGFAAFMYKITRVQNHEASAMRGVLRHIATAPSYSYIDEQQPESIGSELAKQHAESATGVLKLSSDKSSVYGTFLKDDLERSVDFVVTAETSPISDETIVLRGSRTMEVPPEQREELETMVLLQEGGDSVRVLTNNRRIAADLFTDRQSAQLHDFEGYHHRMVNIEIANDQLILRVPIELDEPELQAVCNDAMELGRTTQTRLASISMGASH